MLEIQYFELHRTFHRPGEAWPEVSVANLTGLWLCTERNVKMILKKLEHAGWIEWSPGRGRGHVSRVRFLMEPQELLLDLSKQAVQGGRLNDALEWLERFGQGTDTKERFMAWLSDYFGYKKETADSKPVETLRFPVFRSILTLDPGRMIYAFEAHLMKQLYNTLVTFNEQRQTVEPQVAHYWECSPDHLAWKFYLRRGIMFHHGRELTAHDVAFSLRRLMRTTEPLTQHWLVRGFEEVRVLDERVVEIRLRSPNHLLLRFLCFPATSILPEELVAGREEAFALAPVGSGPFRLELWNESRCVLTANPSYFEGRAHLDRVEVVFLPPEEVHNFQAGDSEKMLCNHEGASYPVRHHWERIELLNNGCTMLSYNMRQGGPQQDVRFRKALHHLVDRKSMVERLGENRRFPATGMQPHDYLGQEDHAFDPAVARKLLDEMGYKGEPFRIAAIWKHLADAYWLRDRCRAFGIEAEVVCYEISELAQRVRDHKLNAEALLHQFVIDEGEVSLLELYLREDSYVRLVMDEELSARVEKIASDLLASPSPEYRKHRMQELEALMNHEHVVLFLLFKGLQTAHDPTLRGVTFNSLGWIDFKNVWLQSV
ncbi:hypothetical protein AV654_17115 [Paenibacillus elgii]|uniref:ABC transporter substrate-binding protein n=1 Tax=Paenibacillus elgii TaxID=189691 RepID=A0A163YC67_9BACL|nr:ABC transporter substrate-binding protein [Paenibacillus elgii]KZE79196.1 hypothetical protein AV654_17115 [Paenibacillus elgii]